MSRKERETQLRRNIIIEAAEKLILLKGYDNTTMDEIADESEYSKGTLYNYFDSKDQIYLAIAIKAYELINEFTREFTAEKEVGIEKLKGIGLAYYEFTKIYPKYAYIFHDIGLKVPNIRDKPNKKLSEIEREYLKVSNDYGKIFYSILSNAIEHKLVRSDIDPYVLGIILSSISTNVVKEIFEHKGDFQKRKIKVDQVMDLLFELIGEGLKPR